MSKIAEKKAEKLFPLKSIDGGEIEAYFNAGQLHKREIYNEGYDQALQDFMEKACEWLKEYTDDYIVRDTDDCWLREDDFIKQFKNYMQNESEN